MKKTDELETLIKNSNTYMFENTIELIPLHEFINDIIKNKKLKKSYVIHNIKTLDTKNGYKYLNGKLPISRDLLLSILITLQFNEESINIILKKYSYSKLYVKNKRDQIIFKEICEKKSLHEINEKLASFEEDLLW